MWVQGEDRAPAESVGESSLSSGDDEDIQHRVLEQQRDEANQRLSELQQASNQLLKEMEVLEVQFQIERSCRESAEALAVEVTKENKVLKRKSQMIIPLIPELPEYTAAVTLHPDTDPTVKGDPGGLEELSNETQLLLQYQNNITELQASVDGLLAEKLQLEQQVEELQGEQVRLREQLALEIQDKEAVLKKMKRQNKTMKKIQRVSQLVTEEFSDVSQQLELQQGLRQQAEVFAHQMLVQQEAAHRRTMMLMQSSETASQLQRALEQISSISTALCDIQRCYQDQLKQSLPSAAEDSSILCELQDLRQQLQRTVEEKAALETHLSEANRTVRQLQEEVKHLHETMKEVDKGHQLEEVKSSPNPPPPPPPPPPLPPPTTNSLDFLRKKRKPEAFKAEQNTSAPLLGMKARAMDEMMERIRKGIVLRPAKSIHVGSEDDECLWTEQRSENRKSAVLELKGMLVPKHLVLDFSDMCNTSPYLDCTSSLLCKLSHMS
ncbi:shootin-1 isoform X2 [Thalassophryne amazonica]|uniref:shootin-1 isoform X2 n=1 Tax=Thalassophryne amazonica TaxID=390379 RepID=UPI001471FE5F|nr:shootin-1 isoform X2 [Thalassophryne amazonica]